MSIKIRIFPEHNYKGIHLNGKTIRIALDPKKPITELLYPEFYDVKVTSYCKGHCPYCFTEETLIKTKDGEKQIKDIQINDIIYNYNEEKKEKELNLISQVFKREYRGEIIEIILENNIVINVTPNHDIYTKNRGWTHANLLTEDDELEIY